MKRLVLSLSIFAIALSFNACEGHKADKLPPHYQHKLGEHHETEHKDEPNADTHAKPGAKQPAAPEKKEH